MFSNFSGFRPGFGDACHPVSPVPERVPSVVAKTETSTTIGAKIQ